MARPKTPAERDANLQPGSTFCFGRTAYTITEVTAVRVRALAADGSQLDLPPGYFQGEKA